MKNILMALMLLGSFATYGYAGECSNGSCTVLNRPVRKVLVVTRNVIAAPVNVTREVVKYQSLRRRLVNRTTNCVSCQ
jgi:hypothetical protein